MEDIPLLRGEIAEMRKPFRAVKLNFLVPFFWFMFIFLRS